MSPVLGEWFPLRYRRFLAWSLLCVLVPLPALLEAGHSCLQGIDRSAPSVLIAGRGDGTPDPPRLWNGCSACQLLRNLSAVNGGKLPAADTVPVVSLRFAHTGPLMPWFPAETSLLPRPPPARGHNQSA
jgi:hypothetical protein